MQMTLNTKEIQYTKNLNLTSLANKVTQETGEHTWEVLSL